MNVVSGDKQVNGERYYSLQALRAVAAWMVVYHHFMQIFFSFHYESAIGRFFSLYGNFGVDIFFVLSGFVMFQSAMKGEKSSLQFLVDRVFRIVPVYWFYTGIMILALMIFPKVFSYTSFDWRSLLGSLFFYPVSNPSGLGIYPLLTVGWTLNFEMFFYVLLSLCLGVSRRLGVALCSLLLLIFPWVYPHDFFMGHIASSKLLYEFLVGMLIAKVWISDSDLIRWIKRFRFFWIMLAVLLVGILAMKVSVWVFLKLPMAALCVCLALLLEASFDWSRGVGALLVKLGDESYSTYLCHAIVMGVFLAAWQFSYDSHWLWPVLMLVSSLIWLCSHLSCGFVERNRHVLACKRWVSSYLMAIERKTPHWRGDGA